jgi:hypothetical protein
MQHHSMQLSGPPHESPQLAVSIRHQADLVPESVGSTVYLWEESKHKRQTISRNPKTQTEVVLTFSRE